MANKKYLIFVLFIFIGLGGLLFIKNKRVNTASEKKINLMTWSNYFPSDVLEKFTAQTGIRVQINYMASNEELFSKMKAGVTGYDIIQPSDYMVRRLSQMNMLKKIDHSKIPNIVHLDDYYKNPDYDKGLLHSVPFTWGTTGIAVNTKKVKIPEEGVSWNLLLNSPDPSHTSLLDDMREVFTVYMKAHQKDSNSQNKQDYLDAKTFLSNLKKRILTFSSEPKVLLLKGEVNIAHIFSCDGVQTHADNPDIEYFIPKEGGTIWTDNFAIPSGSSHPDEAHVFINYFLDPENARSLYEENHLATANLKIKERLPASETSNPNIYPSQEFLKKMNFLQDLPELLPYINELWTEIKS